MHLCLAQSATDARAARLTAESQCGGCIPRAPPSTFGRTVDNPFATTAEHQLIP